jgi:hypothetical protein
MDRSNNLEYIILLFYRVSMLLCLTVVYEYKTILLILIDGILIINIIFVVKSKSNDLPPPKSNDPLPKLPLSVAMPSKYFQYFSTFKTILYPYYFFTKSNIQVYKNVQYYN